MSFGDAIRLLNSFKRRRIIKDYVVIGAVAATAYMEPVFTEDLDIIVMVDTDAEYLKTFRHVGRLAEGQQMMHHVLGGVPVQMFPSTTKPLYKDVLEGARPVRIGGLRVKVASAEHLIVLYLEAFREKDRYRIRRLLPIADANRLQRLLVKFDDENKTLAGRLQTLL